MDLSLHYYVLLLGQKSNKLFEGFRDKLIELENGDFPHDPAINLINSADPTQRNLLLKDLYKKVDQFFDIFYNQDPLGLVLVGDKMNKSLFRSVSVHNEDIYGVLEGNYEATSVHDLGQIVWPIIKEILSGNREIALRRLDDAVSRKKVASGLDEVWGSANSAIGATLLVEEDYRMKGTIVKTDKSWVILDQVDIREVFDDVVDRVIEKVLKSEGIVIFLESGSLSAHQKIALITRD